MPNLEKAWAWSSGIWSVAILYVQRQPTKTPKGMNLSPKRINQEPDTLTSVHNKRPHRPDPNGKTRHPNPWQTKCQPPPNHRRSQPHPTPKNSTRTMSHPSKGHYHYSRNTTSVDIVVNGVTTIWPVDMATQSHVINVVWERTKNGVLITTSNFLARVNGCYATTAMSYMYPAL